MTALTRVGNRHINATFCIISGESFGNLISGYRAFTRKSFQQMRLTVNGFDIQIEMLSKCAKHDIIRSLYPSLASPPRVENKPPPVPGRRQHLLQGLPTLDILPALKREDSNAGQRATLASPLATSRLPNGVGEAIAGSRAIRRPREGCGVFGVHLDAVSACTVHTIRLGETAGMPPVAGFPASGHGRAIGLPALRATVGRHKRARVAFCLPCRHGLGDALSGTV
jgi:hypothetical protein